LSKPGDPTYSRQPLDVAAALARVPLRDPQAAQQILPRILAAVSPSLALALPALFADTPDPDTALILFDRLVSESSEEVLRLLARHNFLAHYAIAVFGHSRYLGETLIQNTDLLHSFLREKNLDRSLSREEFHEALARFRSRSFEKDVSLLLAHFKRREYVRIMLRDVLKIAPLAETTAEISALSDVLIEDALREADSQLRRAFESPQHINPEGRLTDTAFTVLSLGKLGGNELNYSSDVDLLYVYGDGAEPAGAKVSNREYFIRLAQQVTQILSRVTREGPVFRIDLRLRPQGNEGELAVSLGHALRYYADTAHDWERQALIKTRYAAGDPALARELIRGVQPQVYREEVNFAAIKTALEARDKMHARRRRPVARTLGLSIDVKIDRGGIRDIEFLVQCLQRVYGGSEPWLRSGGTLFSLQKLHDKGHINGKEFHDLTSAYEFLRHLEHRLQLRQGQQTHRLPTEAADLDILQRSMARLVPGELRPGYMTDTVRRRMAAVGEIYNRIIYQQQTRKDQAAPDAKFQLRGFTEIAAADQTNHQILERLASDAPALYDIAKREGLSAQARRNLFRFLTSAFTSSERYAAVSRHPEAVSRALSLFEASDYLTEVLIRHPEEIVTLAQSRSGAALAETDSLFGASPDLGPTAPDPVFAYATESSASYGESLALLRRHYRHRIFASGARDISELRPVRESLATTTGAAEDAIKAAFAIAHQPAGFAVMAVGRLGSREFDLLSDADLLFVVEDGLSREAMTHAAEVIMHALSAYTRDGTVFPVDARLRPRGGEGELLTSPTQLNEYFSEEAQAWEALMYTKLRFIAGSREVAGQAQAATAALFTRYAGDAGFLAAVRDMRTRLQQAEGVAKSFKASPGGAYDIDFMTTYLLIKHGVEDKAGSLRERLCRCMAAGLVEKTDAAVLEQSADLLRTAEHVVRLVVGRARKWLPATEHAQQVSEELTARILGRAFPAGLEAELDRTNREVREVYDRVLSEPLSS
jgi:[glutamine synthetase] adenylyltransferase / [glutamine synthetase]-adenylyl-L-tyrosine phosphorylase